MYAIRSYYGDADLPLVDELPKRLPGTFVCHFPFRFDSVQLHDVDDVRIEGTEAVLHGGDHLVDRGDVHLRCQHDLVPDPFESYNFV